MANGDLLLAWSTFVVDHLGQHAHGAYCASCVGEKLGLEVEPRLGVDAGRVGRLPATGLCMPDPEIELRLERCFDAQAALGGAGEHVFEERARAGSIASAVLVDQVAAHARVRRHPGQHRECFRVRQHA